MKEAVGSTEMSVGISQTEEWYIPDDFYLHTHRRDKVKYLQINNYFLVL